MKHLEGVQQGCLQDMLEQSHGADTDEHGRTRGRMIEAVGNGGGADSSEENGSKGILKGIDKGIDKGKGHRIDLCSKCCGRVLSSVASPSVALPRTDLDDLDPDDDDDDETQQHARSCSPL